MTFCKHMVAAALVLAGGQAAAQSASRQLAVDAPHYGAYVGTLIPLAARSLPTRVTADSVRRHVTWESSDPTVAWITNDGTAVLLRPGKVTFTARVGTLMGSRTLDLRESGAHSVALTVDRHVIRLGESARVVASAKDSHGAVIADARPNLGVVGEGATIDSNGNFMARRPGTFRIVGELGGVSTSREIEVAPGGIAQQGAPLAGTLTTARATRTRVADMALRIGGDARVDEKIQVTVDAWARGGRRVTDAPIDYAIAVTPGETSEAGISSDGVFVAHKPGVYTIIAAVDGKADQQTLLVRD
jgi:hypothetical protein